MKSIAKRIIFLFLVFILSLNDISAKSKAKKTDASNEIVNFATEADQWYIYWKSAKNIYKGPFNSLEEAIQAWQSEEVLQPKSKFFIGKNKRLITDDPDKYFKEDESNDLSETEIASSIEENEQSHTQIQIPPITTQQVDRYKKVYLSDFMDLPDHDIPSNETRHLDEDLIVDLNDIDSSGRTSLMNAVRSGNDWKVRALLDAGTDINAKDKDGWTALMYASRYQSNLSILELLLKYNPDIKTLNNYGLSALIIASCYNDNPDVIKKILAFYSPSEKEVQKAFILLLSTQSISEYTLVAKMKVFIETGLPLNSYYDGKTPLMYACKFSSSTKAIKLLLDNNVISSVRSSEGKTAFEYAIENKNLKHDDIYWSLNER